MWRICKTLIPGVLLALSACGTPEQPRSSVIEPPPAPPVWKLCQRKNLRKRNSSKTTSKQAPKQPWHYNYALAANGGTASGCDKPNLLVDGNSTVYDGGDGYAATDWSVNPPQTMLITLKETVDINTVRFLLWDGDPRHYCFKLEVSAEAEGDHWTLISDCTKGEYRGWQLLPFSTQKVRRFKLTGTFNSANNYFHVVEFQADNIPNGFTPHWNEGPAEKPKATDSIGESKDTF